jgi:hypothetical protein
VTITDPAPGTLVGPAGVTVSGTASDDVGVGRVDLAVNGTVVATKYSAPYTFTWKPTQSGTTTLQLRAHDAAGNVGTASRTVTADVTPPDTTIVSQNGSTFSFISSEPGSTFACSLDAAAFVTCASPISYGSLASGTHTFAVRATDPAGNVDPTPATATRASV